MKTKEEEKKSEEIRGNKIKGEEAELVGLNIALGLYREGIPLQGAPGEHNSYAYQVFLDPHAHAYSLPFLS